MLKIYMNEPFATSHELVQARRLVKVLSKEYASTRAAWLCLNFSMGGKSLDAALVTSDRFLIIEFKAVGGDVGCDASMENSAWFWCASSNGERHEIATTPYANPFSQTKSYRTAVIGELEQRQRGFLGTTTLLKDKINFAWWVKCCVLLSQRGGQDIAVDIGAIPLGAKNWFCCATIGDAGKATCDLKCSTNIAAKEVERLITRVIGLRQTDAVLELQDSIRDENAGGSYGHATDLLVPSAIDAFRRRYSRAKKVEVPALDIKVVKRAGKTNVVNDFADIEDLLKLGKEHDAKSSAVGNHRIVAATKVANLSYQKMMLKGEMDYVFPEFGGDEEICGVEAVSIVKKDFPDVDNFEVACVLRFGDRVPVEAREKIIDYFRGKFPDKRARRWWDISYAGGWIEFLFGKSVPIDRDDKGSSTGDEIAHTRPISTNFLMPRWIRALIDKESEGLPSLSAPEVQKTAGLSIDDIRRYARTYFGRSCAESFVLADWILGDRKDVRQASVLDIGCGCGGASLGCGLALYKHAQDGKCAISIDGIDVNGNAIDFAKNLFVNARNQFAESSVGFTGNVQDMSSAFTKCGTYDFVVASKAIGEVAMSRGGDFFKLAIEKCCSSINDHGCVIVIDIPKHWDDMMSAVQYFSGKGYEGWLRKISICMSGTADHEEVACACLYHGESGVKIINE